MRRVLDPRPAAREAASRRLRPALVALVSLALLTLAATGRTSAPAGAAPTSTAVSSSYFVSVCRFSHRSYDDPIVYPDRPSLSHNHTFFGNVSTNAYSTTASLRRAGTTCAPQADTAAYWAPTLLADATPVLPVGANVYYRRIVTTPVRPFPSGLQIVAGNSRAHLPQSHAVTYWDCGVVKTTFYGTLQRETGAVAPPLSAASASIPSCPVTTDLQLHVNFPDCWNGKSLDSTDHASHMAYSSAGRCPSAYPVAVPAISVVLRYKPPIARRIILSSGGQHSGHADFINSWNERALTKLVDDCLNENRGCGIASAPAPDTT